MCLHELYEALCTITRGGSPEEWFLTWQALVSKDGYTIANGERIIPKKNKRGKRKAGALVSSPSEDNAVQSQEGNEAERKTGESLGMSVEGTEKRDRRTKHYETDEPLQMQFDKISVSIHGGLERGKNRRIQPSIGNISEIDVSKSYLMTARSLKSNVDWLNSQVAARQKKCSRLLEDTSVLNKLAREFVNRLSKVRISVDNEFLNTALYTLYLSLSLWYSL